MNVESGIPEKFKKWVESERPSVAIVAKIDSDEKEEIMKQINKLVYKAFKGGWIARNNEVIETSEEFSDYNVGE